LAANDHGSKNNPLRALCEQNAERAAIDDKAQRYQPTYWFQDMLTVMAWVI